MNMPEEEENVTVARQYMNNIKRPWVVISSIISNILSPFFFIFLYLKLIQTINWAWYWVLFPFILFSFISFISQLSWIIFYNPRLTYLNMVNFIIPCGYIITSILISLNLEGIISILYTLATLPIYIASLVASLLSFCNTQPSISNNPNHIDSNQAFFIALSSLLICIKVDGLVGTDWGVALLLPWFLAAFSILVFLFMSCLLCNICIRYFCLDQRETIRNWFQSPRFILIQGIGIVKTKIVKYLGLSIIIVTYLWSPLLFLVTLFTFLFLEKDSKTLFTSIFIFLFLLSFLLFALNMVTRYLLKYLIVDASEVPPGELYDPLDTTVKPNCPMCRSEISSIVQIQNGVVINSMGNKGQSGHFQNGDIFDFIQTNATLFRSRGNSTQVNDSNSTLNSSVSLHRIPSQNISTANIERAKELLRSNIQIIQCYICEENPGDTVILECGHSGVCFTCASKLFTGDLTLSSPENNENKNTTNSPEDNDNKNANYTTLE